MRFCRIVRVGAGVIDRARKGIANKGDTARTNLVPRLDRGEVPCGLDESAREGVFKKGHQVQVGDGSNVGCDLVGHVGPPQGGRRGFVEVPGIAIQG